MATIVVSGALANRAGNGGGAWVRLSWVLGLKKLGCGVHFVEEIGRRHCVDAGGSPCGLDESVNLAYFKKVVRQFGLAETASLIYEGGEQIHGLNRGELLDMAAGADLLVNISGHLASEPFFGRFRRKAYIDIDPGFAQMWHAAGNPGARLAGHDVYFTIGENIGKPGCTIPTCGITWRHTRQPVVLEDWPDQGAGAWGERERGFTTVGSWRGAYGPVQHEGKTYGLKVHEFRRFLELPRRSGKEFEVALDIHPADDKDRKALLANGWRLVDPQAVAADADGFRRYVQGSGAEFSVAQGIYVDTNSGWFSDRTVRYLASGRPALVQETGFSRNLPSGEGLVAFCTLEEAVAGAEGIVRDYPRHCRAARALAETYFDSDQVLRRLLEEGIPP
jgi:hypothetical protein